MVLLTLAVTLRLLGILAYAVAVYRRTARPNLVTWCCWASTPLIGGIAQHLDGRGAAAWFTMSYALGPILILGIALARNAFSARLTAFDLVCAGCAAIGLVLWQVTTSPQWALLFAVLADVAAAMPTLLKTYRRPGTEPVKAYALSILAGTTALLGLDDHRLGSIAFSLGVLTIDVSVVTLALTRRRKSQGAPRAHTRIERQQGVV
ncbi:hypothetical protein [Streptomyces sp. SID13031]|uniref:hypothetical protein n=1 Tax=Streptomyces sp. SID13031 TaxID=2706046 RepID=UPI0013C919DB|nr:hypothetical protein [Streptomyces sp. SID13031]NEA34929.1 hypothetical protein [Streptomyces sp. SID13031]